SKRVIRGGAWDRTSWECRSSYRGRSEPWFHNIDMGFRVAFVPAEKPAEKTVTPAALPPLVDAAGRWKLPPHAPPPAVAPFDAAKAQGHQAAWARHLGVPVQITNSIGMKLALIPPGEFEIPSAVAPCLLPARCR
ncbi:MAG: hypothetical protein ACLQA5_23500, partial [Solirubrobacteraceae bacterium]